MEGEDKINSNIFIRSEEKGEYHEVENLVRESFWNEYRPGCMEHYVLHQLRKDAAFVPELDFVLWREYTTPEGYFVDEKEAEEFDRQFPRKEKKKLPGQILG